jgi:stage V sporulation protein AD
MEIDDPFNMGVAMAPAAVDTIEAHFRDLGISASSYDLILTGDLGRIGHQIDVDLLKPEDRFGDCGLMIYRDDQPVLAGASGLQRSV